MSVSTVQLRKAAYTQEQELAGPPSRAQKDDTCCSSKGPHNESQEHGLHCEHEDLYRPAPWVGEAAVGAFGSGFAAVVAGLSRGRGLRMAAAEMEEERCDRKAFVLRKYEGLDNSWNYFADASDCELLKWLPTTSDGELGVFDGFPTVDSSLAHAWLGEPEGCQHNAEEGVGGGDRMAFGLWGPQSSSASPGALEQPQSSNVGLGVSPKHMGQAKQPDEDVGAGRLASCMPELHSSDADFGVGPKHPGKAEQPDEDVDGAGHLVPHMQEFQSFDALGADPKLPGKPDKDVGGPGCLALGMQEASEFQRRHRTGPEPGAKAVQTGNEVCPKPPVLQRPAGLRRPPGSQGRPGRSLPPGSRPPAGPAEAFPRTPAGPSRGRPATCRGRGRSRPWTTARDTSRGGPGQKP
mmetsp:Transcript_98854/g.300037  ORF Transcript_98854/g.300037 Transcript_98854/m.300037 type:complete len:407 (-) Transcript_98854:505-1725(-)